MKPKQQKKDHGFTLIELLVVVAIISLLSSIALIAYQDTRQKSRDAKRLGDMTQMASALELYFNANKGYPPAVNREPADLSGSVVTLPKAPMPPDGNCAALTTPSGDPANDYSYYPTGTAYTFNGKTLYPKYIYYFCLGNKTGNFEGGIHYVTPEGLR